MTLAIVPKPLKGLYTAGKKRKQEVRTPLKLVHAFADALGGSIPLDPCATRSPLTHVAEENWTSRGLDRGWEKPVYANPPWKYFSEWLVHARLEAVRTGLPTIVLGPWRSHRVVFLSVLHAMEVVYLKALPFEGHTNTMPTPCFVVAWNLTLPKLPWEMGRSVITYAPCPVPSLRKSACPK